MMPRMIPVHERFLRRMPPGPFPGVCWEWPGATHKGYGKIGAGRRGMAPLQVHRVAYEHFVGPIPDGLWVLHRCDNRLCCNPEHLFLGTNLDNVRDMVAKGRQRTVPMFGDRNPMRRHPESVAKGESVHLSKLTDAAVVAIRTRHAAGGVTRRQLAADYGIHVHTVGNVLRRKTWKHLP